MYQLEETSESVCIEYEHLLHNIAVSPTFYIPWEMGSKERTVVTRPISERSRVRLGRGGPEMISAAYGARMRTSLREWTGHASQRGAPVASQHI